MTAAASALAGERTVIALGSDFSHPDLEGGLHDEGRYRRLLSPLGNVQVIDVPALETLAPSTAGDLIKRFGAPQAGVLFALAASRYRVLGDLGGQTLLDGYDGDVTVNYGFQRVLGFVAHLPMEEGIPGNVGPCQAQRCCYQVRGSGLHLASRKGMAADRDAPRHGWSHGGSRGCDCDNGYQTGILGSALSVTSQHVPRAALPPNGWLARGDDELLRRRGHTGRRGGSPPLLRSSLGRVLPVPPEDQAPSPRLDSVDRSASNVRIAPQRG